MTGASVGVVTMIATIFTAGSFPLPALAAAPRCAVVWLTLYRNRCSFSVIDSNPGVSKGPDPAPPRPATTAQQSSSTRQVSPAWEVKGGWVFDPEELRPERN